MRERQRRAFRGGRRRETDPRVRRGAGLADPGPIAQALWADDAVEPGAVLDGIVCVVDAKHFRQQLAEAGGEAQLQVAFADLVLLNKTDLVVRASRGLCIAPPSAERGLSTHRAKRRRPWWRRR